MAVQTVCAFCYALPHAKEKKTAESGLTEKAQKNTIQRTVDLWEKKGEETCFVSVLKRVVFQAEVRKLSLHCHCRESSQ